MYNHKSKTKNLKFFINPKYMIKNVYLKSINFDSQVQNCGSPRSYSGDLLQIMTQA